MAESRVRVLLVDEDPAEYQRVGELLGRYVSPTYELENAKDDLTALEILGQGRHDVALVAERLGGRDGVDLVRHAVGRGCATPLILLSSRDDRALDIAAHDAGAVAFLLKGELGSALLDRSLRYAAQRGGAEASLRHSERFARSVLDSLASHIAVVDERGRIIHVNRSWREFARSNGADVAEVCEGADYLRACEQAGAEGAEFAAGIGGVLCGERESFTLEYPCHSPEKRRWFTGRVTPLRGVRPLHAVVSHVNVTERKLSEEARRQSESIFRSFFDGVPILLGIIEIEGGDFRFVSANPGTARHFGQTPSSLQGRLASELEIPRESIDLWVEKSREAERTGVPVAFDFVDDRGFGPRRMAGLVCVLGPSDRGMPQCACIVEDLTDRFHAEEALRASEGRYRLLAENATDLISRHSPAGEFLYASPACSSLIGYTPAELEARSWSELVHPEDRANVCNTHVALVQSPAEAGRVTFRALRKDGVELWLETTSRAILDPVTGDVLELLCTSRDVSERVRAEGDVRTLNEHIQRRLQRINALRRVDQAITSSRDLRHTLGIVAEQASSQLGVDLATVRLFEMSGERPLFSCGENVGPWSAERDGLLPASSLSARVAVEGSPLHLPDLAQAVEWLPESRRLLAEGYVAYHALPLVAEGHVRGVLELLHRAPVEPDAEWLGFAEALAVQATIAINNDSLLEGLRFAHAQLAAAYEATIEGWARVLDLRDKETEGHSRRVTELTVRTARAMGLDEAELVHIRRGALLHDIGKMGIPDEILLKPGPLNEIEREVMRRHPGLAVEMLWPVEFLRPALDIPYCHHERWDGKGYPRGLIGEQIPLPARIFAAVDVWDALTHDRPYRKAWPRQTVVEHIRSLAGAHFDPRVVDAFLSLVGDPSYTEIGIGDGREANFPMTGDPSGCTSEASPGTLEGAQPLDGGRSVPEVLVAHHDHESARCLVEMLEAGRHRVVLASDGEEAWRLFCEGSFRLVVVAGDLPGIDGFELCRRIRNLFERPYTYLMLATESAAVGDRMSEMGCGADEVLVKPYGPREVAARLEVARRILAVQDDLFTRALDAERVQAELRRQNEQLSEMVVKDPLTGLYNRTHLIEVMDAQLALACRRGEPLSVVKLEIDQFQRFNDEFDRLAGDEALRIVANVLKANVRSHDLVCRYAGETFVIVLPGADASASLALAERLRSALTECRWPRRPLTASFGVATRSNAPWDSALLLVQAARALDQSKREGADHVTHHDGDSAGKSTSTAPILIPASQAPAGRN